MSPKNRNFLFPSSTSSNFVLLIYIFVLTCLLNLCLSEECVYINDCKCVFNNGSIIDLTSLANKDNKPLFENQKPTLINDTYTYSYTPCHKFSLGTDGGCENVDVCQTSRTGEHFDVGNKVFPQWNNKNHTLHFLYTSSDSSKETRKTNVTLKCSLQAKEPKLVVIGETSTAHYEMILTTRCACADACRESHLSGGSVLVILFLIFVSLYLVLGIIHSSLTRGAHGWELIPHHEFWADFPLLVRDGCVFVMSGCKADTAYERI